MPQSISARGRTARVVVLGRRDAAFTESLGLLLRRCGLAADVLDPVADAVPDGDVGAVVVCEGVAREPAHAVIAALRARCDVVVVALDGCDVSGADVNLKPTAEVEELLRLLPVSRSRLNGAAPLRHVRARSRHATGAAAWLTVRERQLLFLIARGMSNDAIAENLEISRHTVRTHVQNILAKLGARSRLEAAGMAEALLGHQFEERMSGAAQ